MKKNVYFCTTFEMKERCIYLLKQLIIKNNLIC